MFTGAFVAIQDSINIHAKKYTAVRSTCPSMPCGAARVADSGVDVAVRSGSCCSIVCNRDRP